MCIGAFCFGMCDDIDSISLGLYDSWHQKPCPDCGGVGVLTDSGKQEFGIRECDDCGSVFDISN